MQKHIGTFIPMASLVSKNNKRDNGTFAAGLIFLDWLHKTNQSLWQMLPLNETQLEPGSSEKHVPSPYKNYGIGLDPKYLPLAFVNKLPTEHDMKGFVSVNKDWIHDYALFCALRDYFQTDDWSKWDKDLKNRKAVALEKWSEKLVNEIETYVIIQWQLDQAYAQLKNKAKKLSIKLIGDIPFYASYSSPLVWANQSVFELEENGSMGVVSGVPNIPPSFFGRQVWGHPLYNWKSKESWEKINAFWQMRLAYMSRFFDLIRFDHARAFHQYGAMDLENEKNDQNRKGPGGKAFEELIKFGKQCGISIFVEDDSVNKIDEMKKSLKLLKSPAIKIFRFALNEQTDKIIDEYADIDHYKVKTIAYTTTHDTETLLGFFIKLTMAQKNKLAAHTGVSYDGDDVVFAKKVRDAILRSPAYMVIIPMQDWLLITERINIPGTELPVNDPNWRFRMSIPIENLPVHF